MFVVCGTQHWRVELPPGWCAQHGPGNVAIYHPDGAGALQISSLRKPRGEVAEADLRDMAAGVPTDANGLRPVQVGEFAGLRCESLDDRTHWVRWFVARGAVALHLTYNCPALGCEREREAVERVVASLKCQLPQR
ncbi:MAG: hypothetical protein U0840_01880 [Gemmataceae bacterium]